jgi:hypothetical protein
MSRSRCVLARRAPVSSSRVSRRHRAAAAALPFPPRLPPRGQSRGGEIAYTDAYKGRARARACPDKKNMSACARGEQPSRGFPSPAEGKDQPIASARERASRNRRRHRRRRDSPVLPPIVPPILLAPPPPAGPIHGRAAARNRADNYSASCAVFQPLGFLCAAGFIQFRLRNSLRVDCLPPSPLPLPLPLAKR